MLERAWKDDSNHTSFSISQKVAFTGLRNKTTNCKLTYLVDRQAQGVKPSLSATDRPPV